MPRPARDRQLQILQALVQLFVQRREPVSSRMIEESGTVDVKSATIRSVLGDLERQGYLVQPHASSGRIPTDLGYRAYVDGLRMVEQPIDPTALSEVQSAIHEAGADLEQVLHAIHRVIGRMSNNIAILGGPADRTPTIVGVDLYHRDSQHVFVVVSLEGGATRTELVRLDREIVPESVYAAASVLAHRLVGRSPEDVRLHFEDFLPPPADEETTVARDVALGARQLFDARDLLQFSYEGLGEALVQPEFADPERLKALLELIAQTDTLQSTLERTTMATPGELALTIGRENDLPALHPFSLLATRFEVDDRIGYFAVLGPRRMPYAQTAGLIRLIARHLQRARG